MTINWQLRIEDVEKEDEGLYECQVSTSPPRVYRFELKVSGENRETPSVIFMGTLIRATIILNV